MATATLISPYKQMVAQLPMSPTDTSRWAGHLPLMGPESVLRKCFSFIPYS